MPWLDYPFCFLFINKVYAQDDPCSRYDGRPMPDWIMGATPEPHDNSYYYKVFEAENSDREVARNMAINKAFQQAMTFVSTRVNSTEVFEAIQKGANLNVISETFSIPIYFTCEFAKKTPDGQKGIYWILCQIAIAGNVYPLFDTHFSDCNTHEIWDRQKEDCINGIHDAQIKSNARALVASTFIPGVGQMLKKQGGTGAAFLISEVVLFGGATTCYFLGQNQAKIMKSPGTSYTDYLAAKKSKQIYDIAMYTGFGLGAAVHIGNMIHAWCVKDKSLSNNLTFVPAVIPINEYSTPTYAAGAGLQIKF